MQSHLWSTDYEEPAGINVEDGFFIEIFRWNDVLDYFVHDGSAKLIERYLLAVLQRHDDGVNSNGHACTLVHYIFAGDLLIILKKKNQYHKMIDSFE